MSKKYIIVIGSTALLLLAFIFIDPFQQIRKSNEKKPEIQRLADSLRAIPPPLSTIDSTKSNVLQSQAMVKDDPNFVSGIVEPFVDVTLGLFVPGRIDKILFTEGQRVREGGVILYLEKQQEELEVMRRKMIWQNRAELRSAMATVLSLTGTLEANRRLYTETRSVSKEELDRLNLQWETAVSERDRLLVQEKREKVEYDMAIKTLESRILKATVGGVVERIYLKEGEIYQNAQPLVRLINSDRCLLTLNLDDTRSYYLQQGMIVDLLINAGESEIAMKGVITKVPLVVDPASGVMQVKVVFENRDGRIKPGVTGRMRLPVKK
jgi:RND family efflux transporter MFP subunit